MLREALELYQTLGDSYYVAMVLKWLGHTTANTDGEKDLAYKLESLAVAQKAGIPNQVTWLQGDLGFLYLNMGRYADAEASFTEAVERLLILGDRKWRTMCLAGLSLTEFFAGHFDQARERADETLRTAGRFDLRHQQFVGQAVLALLHTGNPVTLPEARRLLDDAMAEEIDDFWWKRYTVQMANAVVTYAQADRQRAWAETPESLQILAEEAAPLPFLISCLIVIALLLADDGEWIRAAELLGFVLNHPAAPLGWLEQWPLFVQKRQQLEADLGADAYEVAWARGQDRELDAVVADLLADLAAD